MKTWFKAWIPSRRKKNLEKMQFILLWPCLCSLGIIASRFSMELLTSYNISPVCCFPRLTSGSQKGHVFIHFLNQASISFQDPTQPLALNKGNCSHVFCMSFPYRIYELTLEHYLVWTVFIVKHLFSGKPKIESISKRSVSKAVFPGYLYPTGMDAFITVQWPCTSDL